MSDHDATLKALLEAFNAHDLDAIMSLFTDDCLLDTPRGPAPGGTRFAGKEEVRRGLQARFDGIPDIVYADDRRAHRGPRMRPLRAHGRQDQPQGLLREDRRLTRGPASRMGATPSGPPR